MIQNLRGAAVRLALVAAVSATGVTAPGTAVAQAFKTGDRVECNVIGSTDPKYAHQYYPGTVQPFNPGDGPDGSWYRVKIDSNGQEYYCKIEVLRMAPKPGAPAPFNAPAFMGGVQRQGAGAFQPGDKVECNIIGSTDPKYSHHYYPGTIQPFEAGDGPDGSWYRVKLDSNGVQYPCKVEVIRMPQGGGGR